MRFRPTLHASLAALALGLGGLTAAMAQAENSTTTFANPYPESGRWFANDASRTGLFIEVQNGIVAGLYVGADGSGDDVWLSFSGRLEGRASTDFSDGWILDTELLRFSGAGCIVDCLGDAPVDSTFETVGEIRLEFLGRNEGIVSVGGGEARAIAPIQFGVVTREIRPIDPPRFLPDLEGQWVVASASSSGFPQSITGSTVVTLGPASSETFPVLSVPPPRSIVETITHPIVEDTEARFPPDSVIECNRFSRAGEIPECFLVFPSGPMALFSIPFDTISDARFTVIQQFDVPGDSIQHTFFRLNHD